MEVNFSEQLAKEIQETQEQVCSLIMKWYLNECSVLTIKNKYLLLIIESENREIVQKYI